MYPNQQSGYNQQAPPFGAGYPSSMPMPQQAPPFGAGYPSSMPMPQAMPPQGAPYGGGFQMPPGGGGGFPNQMPPMGQPAYQPPPQQAGGFMPQSQPFGQGYLPQQPPAQGGYPTMPPAQYGSPVQPQAPPVAAPPAAYPGYGDPNQFPVQQQYQQPVYQAAPTYAAPQTAPIYGGQQSAPVRRGRPTVAPTPNFNASNDSAALRKAMKGWGTDNDALIAVLCNRTNQERMEIVRAYKTGYGKDLLDDIRSETTGNFENILIALLTNTTELYCRELFEAMSGAGTDEDVLIEVMCTMSNYEIRQICALYTRMYGQPLEHQLRSDTSGSMKRLMTSLSVGGRDESMITDVNQARIDAQTLKKAGVDKFGTDESEFNRILCLRNYEQLKLVCQEYEKLTGHTLEKDIKREFSGDIEDALLAIIRVANNRPEFFARRLHKSMAGMGTNDKSLIRLVVTRSEIDMMDVKEEFQRYYGKSLKSFIKGDTSGNYKHALYALCGENRS